jgi:hypothetical protein
MKIFTDLKIKLLKCFGRYDVAFYEVCCHEAGHAFFAKLQGLNVLYIRVISKDTGVTSIDWGRLKHIQILYSNSMPGSILNTSIADVRDFIDSHSAILIAGPIAQLLPGNEWSFHNKSLSIEASGSDYEELQKLEESYDINTDSLVGIMAEQFTPSVNSMIKHLANYLYLNKCADIRVVNDILDKYIADLSRKIQG